MTGAYRYIAILIGLVGLYALGYFHGHSDVPVVTQTHEVVTKGDTQTIEKVVYRDRIVTRTVETVRKPDGTVITKEVDHSKEDTESDRKSKDVRTQVAVTDTEKGRTNYMLGVMYRLDRNTIETADHWDRQNLELQVGRRLMGDIWLEATASQQDMSIGIMYQW